MKPEKSTKQKNQTKRKLKIPQLLTNIPAIKNPSKLRKEIDWLGRKKVI